MMNKQLRNIKIIKGVKKLEYTENATAHLNENKLNNNNSSLIWSIKHVEAAKKHMMFYNYKKSENIYFIHQII